MKLTTILIAGLLSFTTACAKEVPVEPPKPAEVTTTAEQSTPIAPIAPVTKRVCITVYDAKQKKDVVKCREVKIHKKHEGTKIPDGKK